MTRLLCFSNTPDWIITFAHHILGRRLGCHQLAIASTVEHVQIFQPLQETTQAGACVSENHVFGKQKNTCANAKKNCRAKTHFLSSENTSCKAKKKKRFAKQKQHVCHKAKKKLVLEEKARLSSNSNHARTKTLGRREKITCIKQGALVFKQKKVIFTLRKLVVQPQAGAHPDPGTHRRHPPFPMPRLVHINPLPLHISRPDEDLLDLRRSYPSPARFPRCARRKTPPFSATNGPAALCTPSSNKVFRHSLP